MSSDADVLPGHDGTCANAEGWGDERYGEVAERVVRDYRERFARHRAGLHIVPITFSFELRRGRLTGRERVKHVGRSPRGDVYVGDGLRFLLEPLEGSKESQWLWWNEAEADMAIRQRRTGDQEWTVLHSPGEVEELLRRQAETYLRQFAASEANPDAPYHHHDGTA